MTASGATRHIASVVLRSPAPARLAAFYRAAFDFVDATPPSDARVALRLDSTVLAIERAAPDGAPYPGDVPGWSPLFQHCAIRVASMAAAMMRLAGVDGWRPISTDGPETLPANTGGVTAFKFRDPDGHPLELLAFPTRRDGPLFADIDHSAISVVDVDRSIAFYAAFGFVVAGRSLNRGPEQERLDAVAGATVDVVGLRTPSGTAPHLELLAYRDAPRDTAAARSRDGDVAATRLVLAGGETAGDARTLRDPDGHRLDLVP